MATGPVSRAQRMASGWWPWKCPGGFVFPLMGVGRGRPQLCHLMLRLLDRDGTGNPWPAPLMV